MNTKLQDTIERVFVLKASIQRVYHAISSAEGLVKWFPNRIEGKVEPGETAQFHFDGCGICSLYIVGAEPYGYFAFRWASGATAPVGDVLASSNTLVEFRLEEVEEGTKLTMVESGFASLPKETYEQAMRDNNSGWDSELAELVALFNQS